MDKDEINLIVELVNAIKSAIQQTKQLSDTCPAFPLWPSINEQLELLNVHLEQGLKPDIETLQRIDIGLIAARELEFDFPDYAELLESIDYAVSRWDELK